MNCGFFAQSEFASVDLLDSNSCQILWILTCLASSVGFFRLMLLDDYVVVVLTLKVLVTTIDALGHF